MASNGKLTKAKILAWADAYQSRHGEWPTQRSGPIDGAGTTWMAVDKALRFGFSGLPAAGSLARLLAAKRGFEHQRARGKLSVSQILAWAKTHRRRKGRWPTSRSGPLDGVPGETWKRIDNALRQGRRGLQGGTSLSRLMANHRDADAQPAGRMTAQPAGRMTAQPAGRMTVRQILCWADVYHRRHGSWPTQRSGPIDDEHELTWAAVHQALYHGWHGLPKGASLHRLLANERGATTLRVRRLTVAQVLAWADAFHARHGRRPSSTSGPIDGAPDLTWHQVHLALRFGRHGLPGSSTLARLLRAERGPRKQRKLPPLDVESILAWVDAYRARHDRWPTRDSGPVDGVPGETWAKLDTALNFSLRGLDDECTLAQFLAAHRDAPAVSYD